MRILIKNKKNVLNRTFYFLPNRKLNTSEIFTLVKYTTNRPTTKKGPKGITFSFCFTYKYNELGSANILAITITNKGIKILFF